MNGATARNIRNMIYGADANGRFRKYSWLSRMKKNLGKVFKLDAGDLRQQYQKAKKEYTRK